MEEALSMECLNKMCPVYLELLKVNKPITLWIMTHGFLKKHHVSYVTMGMES